MPDVSTNYSPNPISDGIAIQQVSQYEKIIGSNNDTHINLIPKDWYNYLVDLQKEKSYQNIY